MMRQLNKMTEKPKALILVFARCPCTICIYLHKPISMSLERTFLQDFFFCVSALIRLKSNMIIHPPEYEVLTNHAHYNWMKLKNKPVWNSKMVLAQHFSSLLRLCYWQRRAINMI
jgi:hypothetical protein